MKEKKRIKPIHAILSLCFLYLLLPFTAWAGINIEGSLTHEVTAGPGDTYTGTIIIQNTGQEVEEVKLYQTDYRTEAGGATYYPDPGTMERSNSDWVTVSPKRFFISGGESYTVHFSITIPSDESLTGTYWSLLMVEGIPKESPESSNYNPEEVNVGVQTILRYGVRMITHINYTGTITPEIISSRLEKEELRTYLFLDIANSGTRLFRVNFWAELYTEDGDFIGKFEGDKLAVFPGSSVRFRTDLTSAPKDKYLALVVLDCGENNVFGINYNLVLE